MKRIPKTELIEGLATHHGLTAGVVKGVVDNLLLAIVNQCQNGDQVAIAGFGTFEMRHRAARVGRNMQTGLPMDIPASRALGFKAAKATKVVL